VERGVGIRPGIGDPVLVARLAHGRPAELVKGGDDGGLPGQVGALDGPAEGEGLDLDPDPGQVLEAVTVQRHDGETELRFGADQALLGQAGQRLPHGGEANAEPLAQRTDLEPGTGRDPGGHDVRADLVVHLQRASQPTPAAQLAHDHRLPNRSIKAV
jgi:hypothetical protein